MEDEIKKCPFCASTKSRMESWQIGVHPNLHREFAVMCENCGAFGPNDLGKSGAIEAWNMRRETFPAPRGGNDD